MTVFEGLLFNFAETGTEGHYWALQENHIQPNWSYNDLHILEDNDKLTIWDEDKKEVWSGNIHLRPNPRYMEENIHVIPANFDKQEWYEIFFSRKYTGKIER